MISDDLIALMRNMPIVDSHEHLPAEKEILATSADVFTRIYCQYSITAARSAGLAITREELADTNILLEERWAKFRPYLSAIQNTGYARAAHIAARDLYGINEINDSTYEVLTEKLRQATSAGLYNRLLKDRCNIRRVLNQGSWHDGPAGYAVSIFREFMYLPEIDAPVMRRIIAEWQTRYGGVFASAREWIAFWCGTIAEQGHIGIKFSADMPTDPIDDETAEGLFEKLRDKHGDDSEAVELGIWLMHQAIDLAPAYGFVVAIHCGLAWEIDSDFRVFNPTRIVPLLIRYRHVTFDLYHAGIPWVREMGVIGNQYPNAHLNLCWAHQISPYMTEQLINEWIDLVPLNKIIGFGGDTISPEKVYGIREMTFENLARALASRLERGLVTENRAEEICRLWLFDNACRIYRLSDSN